LIEASRCVPWHGRKTTARSSSGSSAPEVIAEDLREIADVESCGEPGRRWPPGGSPASRSGQRNDASHLSARAPLLLLRLNW